MTLLKAHLSKHIDVSELIPCAMVRRYEQRKIPLKKFLDGAKVSKMMGITLPELKRYVIHSKTVFGAELKDGTLFIHPDGVFKIIAEKFKRMIKRELRSRQRRLNIR